MPPPLVGLRRYRRAADLTQDDLARAAGVSRYHIQALERTRRTPKLELARRLAAILEAPLDRLFPPTDTGAAA